MFTGVVTQRVDKQKSWRADLWAAACVVGHWTQHSRREGISRHALPWAYQESSLLVKSDKHWLQRISLFSFEPRHIDFSFLGKTKGWKALSIGQGVKSGEGAEHLCGLMFGSWAYVNVFLYKKWEEKQVPRKTLQEMNITVCHRESEIFWLCLCCGKQLKAKWKWSQGILKLGPVSSLFIYC